MPERIDPDLNAPILHGLSLPTRARGRMTQATRTEWIDVTLELMARGIRNPTQLRQIVGLQWSTCRSLVEDAKMRMAMQLDDCGELEARREALYWEADAVAREAFRRSFDEHHAPSKVGYLRIVLEANKRKANLCGLDSVQINAHVKTEIKTSIDIAADIEHKFSLPPGALEFIGKETAQAISIQALEILEGEILDPSP